MTDLSMSLTRTLAAPTDRVFRASGQPDFHGNKA